MAKATKLLDRMRSHPRGDWTIDDLLTVAKALQPMGFDMKPPRRGSHYTLRHPSQETILTIPAKRPIKAVYVRKFVAMVDAVLGPDGDAGP